MGDVGPNAFLRTHKLTQLKEDHLTEFFAAALGTSDRLRRSYVDLVLQPYAEARGWGSIEISKVETQTSYPGIGCPDMRLTLTGSSGRTHTILCEHKLRAAETLRVDVGADGDERDVQKQLERYLTVDGAGGVVYVRSDPREPDAKVMQHPKYVRPTGERSHFLWRDFFGILRDDQGSQFSRQLADGFETLGLTPPHPTIGDLQDEDLNARQRARKNFEKFWLPMRSMAADLGWKIEGGDSVELYFRGHAESLAELIWVNPWSSGRFVVRVTPGRGSLEEIASVAEKVAASVSPVPEVGVVAVDRTNGKVNVVDLVCGFNAVLGDVRDVASIERRLCGFVGPILQAFS